MNTQKKARWDSLYEREYILWLVPAVITLLTLIAVYSFSRVTFMSNDDYVLMASLSGKLTGEPTFYSPYVNPIFAYLLSYLYTITDKVNWYVLYHVVLQICSIPTIGYCVLGICRRKKIAIWKGILSFLWMLFGLFLYPMSSISFTMTAIVSSTTSVSLLLGIDFERDSTQRQRGMLVAAALFIFFGYILRPFPVIATFCFTLLISVYLVAKEFIQHRTFKRPKIYRVSSFVVCASLLLTGAIVAQKVENRNNQEFLDFNVARSLYMDYPHLRYQDIPEAYEDLGISEELAYILDQWCFADEKIDTHVLETLVEAGSLKEIQPVRRALAMGAGLIRENKFVLSHVAICFLLVLAPLYYGRKKKYYTKYWLELLTMLCAFVGAFLQCFFLCWMGRFVQHAFFAASIPCVVSVMSLFLVISDNSVLTITRNTKAEGGLRPKLAEIFRNGTTILMILLIGLTCFKPTNYTFNHDLNQTEREEIELAREFTDYVSEHSQNIYMFDAASKNDIDPFPKDSKGSCYNALSWGDSYYHSPAYDAQIEAMGRDSFYLDTLLEDNAFFVSDPRKYSIYGVLTYMCAEYGVVAIESVDNIRDTLHVYRFHQLPHNRQHTGFVDAYGMRYYLKHGEIQTGWLKVDGRIYYGRPATIEASAVQKEINGRDYIVTDGGSLARGFVDIDDSTYFFNSDGTMETGWVYIQEAWRYFGEDGTMVCSGWIKQNNCHFYVDEQGRMIYMSGCGKISEEEVRYEE